MIHLQMLFKKVSMYCQTFRCGAPGSRSHLILIIRVVGVNKETEQKLSGKNTRRSWPSADSAEHGQLWVLCDCWRFKKPLFACVCWGSRIPWNSNPQRKVYLRIRYNLQLDIFHYRENDDAPAYGMSVPIVSPRIDIPIIPKDPDRILLCDLAGSERLKKSDVRRPVYLTTCRFYLELC